jgi:hypothetical protein
MERATGIEPATSSLGISFRRSHRMSLPIRIHHFRPHGRSPLLTICHSFSRYLGSILGSRCRTPRHAGHQSAARARSVGPGALGFLNMGGPQGDSRSTRVRPPDDPEGLVRDPAEERRHLRGGQGPPPPGPEPSSAPRRVVGLVDEFATTLAIPALVQCRFSAVWDPGCSEAWDPGAWALT